MVKSDFSNDVCRAVRLVPYPDSPYMYIISIYQFRNNNAIDAMGAPEIVLESAMGVTSNVAKAISECLLEAVKIAEEWDKDTGKSAKLILNSKERSPNG